MADHQEKLINNRGVYRPPRPPRAAPSAPPDSAARGLASPGSPSPQTDPIAALLLRLQDLAPAAAVLASANERIAVEFAGGFLSATWDLDPGGQLSRDLRAHPGPFFRGALTGLGIGYRDAVLRNLIGFWDLAQYTVFLPVTVGRALTQGNPRERLRQWGTETGTTVLGLLQLADLLRQNPLLLIHQAGLWGFHAGTLVRGHASRLLAGSPEQRGEFVGQVLGNAIGELLFLLVGWEEMLGRAVSASVRALSRTRLMDDVLAFMRKAPSFARQLPRRRPHGPAAAANAAGPPPAAPPAHAPPPGGGPLPPASHGSGAAPTPAFHPPIWTRDNVQVNPAIVASVPFEPPPAAARTSGDHYFLIDGMQRPLSAQGWLSPSSAPRILADQRYLTGSNSPYSGLHASHLLPAARGGSGRLYNLVPLESEVNLSQIAEIERYIAGRIRDGEHIYMQVYVEYVGSGRIPRGLRYYLYRPRPAGQPGPWLMRIAVYETGGPRLVRLF